MLGVYIIANGRCCSSPGGPVSLQIYRVGFWGFGPAGVCPVLVLCRLAGFLFGFSVFGRRAAVGLGSGVIAIYVYIYAICLDYIHILYMLCMLDIHDIYTYIYRLNLQYMWYIYIYI